MSLGSSVVPVTSWVVESGKVLASVVAVAPVVVRRAVDDSAVVIADVDMDMGPVFSVVCRIVVPAVVPLVFVTFLSVERVTFPRSTDWAIVLLGNASVTKGVVGGAVTLADFKGLGVIVALPVLGCRNHEKLSRNCWGYFQNCESTRPAASTKVNKSMARMSLGNLSELQTKCLSKFPRLR